MPSPVFRHTEHSNLLGKYFINALFSFGKCLYRQEKKYISGGTACNLSCFLSWRYFVKREKNPRLSIRQFHLWIPGLPLPSSLTSDRSLNLSDRWFSNLQNWEIIPTAQCCENKVRHKTASGKTIGHNADNEVFGSSLSAGSLAWLILGSWSLCGQDRTLL